MRVSLSHRLRLLVVLTILACGAQEPAHAFSLDFLVPSFLSRKPPPPEPQKVIRPDKPRTSRPIPQRQPFAVPTADAEKLPPTAQQVVMVLGDSLGIQLGQGLREALAEKPEIGVSIKARGNTGLVNTSERDWPKFTRELAQSTERNSVTLILIGTNDGQALRDEKGVIQELGSEGWAAAYRKRVDDMVLPMKEKSVPVLWVGLPIARSDKLSAIFSGLNKIARERVEKAGQRYLDVWEVFADSEGRYDENGPDISGDIVKLRAGDGVHLTKAGARKLAFFVERDLSKLMPGASAPASAALPDEVKEQIRQQAPPAPPGAAIDLRTAVPLPDAAALAPELRKREAGPIVPLTVAPVAPSGTLAVVGAARAPADPAARAAAKLSDEVFAAGRAQYPKPNRGDDFSWPRR